MPISSASPVPFAITLTFIPDLNGGDPQKVAKFYEIAEAYAILSDPEQKQFWDKIYQDELLKQQRTENSSSYFRKARATAVDIEQYIRAMYKEVNMYKEAARRSALTGLAWLIGGLVVTFGSYAVAVNNGGGEYIIAWGAILFGGIQAVRNFYNYIRINTVVANTETKMWEAFK